MYTPGPWRATRQGASVFAGQFQVAFTAFTVDPDQRKSNAVLIAASPDLLSNLQSLFEFVEKYKSALIGTECTSAEYENVARPAAEILAKLKGDK